MNSNSISYGQIIRCLMMVASCFILAGCSQESNRQSAAQFSKTWTDQIFVERAKLENDKSFRTDLSFFRQMEKWCLERSLVTEEPNASLYGLLAKFYADGQSKLAACLKAIQRLEAAGGADFPALLNDPEKSAIENHLRLVVEARTALETLTESERLATKWFKEQITPLELNNESQSVYVKTFNANTNDEQRKRLRAADFELFDGFEKALNLVLEDWEAYEQSKQTTGEKPFVFSSEEKNLLWDQLMNQIFSAKAKYN